MRIAYVSADHGIPVFGDKGAAVHVQEMVKAFASLGHEVRLLAARLGEVRSGLPATVIKVRAEAEEPLVPSGAGATAERLAKERRYLAVGKRMEVELAALHAAWPFDLVYERYALWSAAGPRVARHLGVPCVLEVNAPLVDEQRLYRKLVLEAEATALEREAFGLADRVVAVSAAVAVHACARGARPETTLVVPNGIDPDRFHPDLRPLPLGLPAGRRIVGFAGSLRPWHGLELLLGAFRALAPAHEDAHLLIVGEGPLRGWIEGYLSGAGLEERATITGWLDPETLPRALRAMDVATAPYPPLEPFYFSPLKLFEYMAVGLPVVASGMGQVAEVIQDGENGLLATAGDVADLAAKLARLLDDPALRHRLGAAAARGAQDYTWRGNACRILGSIAAGDNPPAPERAT